MVPRTALGVDIGGTNLRVARLSSGGTVEDRLAVAVDRDPERLAALVEDLARRLMRPEVAAIGVGVPGRIDHGRRRALSGGYVDLSGIDLVRRLETAFARPVALDNDVAMALAGEHAFGAARGYDEVVMIAVGTGIGGAIISAGRTWRGGGNAGQLGHLAVAPGGPGCACGRRGCFEALAAGPALGRLVGEAGLPSGTRAEDIVAGAARGDRQGRAVALAWARALRAGIDTLSAAFDPRMIVIGGGLGRAACAALEFCPPESSWFTPPIVPAALGEDAGLAGCAATALCLLREGGSA
jgi:glucokinase